MERNEQPDDGPSVSRTPRCGARISRTNGVRKLRFFFNGEPIEAFEGETVAAALLASGRRTIRHSDRRAAPRGLFCGMGVCCECMVRINGTAAVLACQTRVTDGMTVLSRLHLAGSDSR